LTFNLIRGLRPALTASLICFIATPLTVAETPKPAADSSPTQTSIDIQYLEIVTTDVDDTIATLEEVHGVTFGEPVPSFGNAQIAILSNGGQFGVRAPLSPDEGAPVIRPYLGVEDIEAAIAAAQASGAQFAMLATEIPGYGKFAIYFQGGIQYGLWEK
jgi:predicted enzyme related to lactoylglutathione lyase